MEKTTSMKKKYIERIAANINRDIVLEFAAYLIINIYDAKCAAEALMEKELFGQARSMAILALEELGKFGPTLAFLSNPAEHPNYIQECFGHRSKQLRGHLLMSVVPLLTNAGLLTDGANTQDMGDLLRKLDKRLSENVSQVEAEITNLVPELQQIIENAESGVIEEQRQNGLYVSFAINNVETVHVRHPRLVSKLDAEKVLGMLSAYSDQAMGDIFGPMLEKYASSMVDDSSWVELISAFKMMVEDLAKHLAENPLTVNPKPS
jgi:AbiV family abortive infection protein